jgi:hypothetical protein
MARLFYFILFGRGVMFPKRKDHILKAKLKVQIPTYHPRLLNGGGEYFNNSEAACPTIIIPVEDSRK